MKDNDKKPITVSAKNIVKFKAIDNAMNKHVQLLTVTSTGWGFTDEEKAVRHTIDEVFEKQYLLRRMWMLSLLDYMKNDLKFDWEGIQKLTGRKRQTWSNLVTSEYIPLDELTSVKDESKLDQLFRGIASLNYRPVTNGFIRAVTDAIASHGMEVETAAFVKAFEHGLTVAYIDKKKQTVEWNMPIAVVSKRLFQYADGSSSMMEWSQILGESHKKGVVSVVSNWRKTTANTKDGTATLHGLEFEPQQTFPMINTNLAEPHHEMVLDQYLEGLEVFCHPLVDDGEGNKRPDPIRAPKSSALYDYFEDQKAQMEEEAKFNPYPEPPDLNVFRSDRTVESLNKAKAHKESRILGHPANQGKGVNLYDLARNTTETILRKQVEGERATDVLGFYDPVQLEFECHPNWFEDGTGEAVFEVRINYRDGIKSGHAIRMVGSDK